MGKGRLANVLPRFVASGYLMIRRISHRACLTKEVLSQQYPNADREVAARPSHSVPPTIVSIVQSEFTAVVAAAALGVSAVISISDVIHDVIDCTVELSQRSNLVCNKWE